MGTVAGEGDSSRGRGTVAGEGNVAGEGGL